MHHSLGSPFLLCAVSIASLFPLSGSAQSAASDGTAAPTYQPSDWLNKDLPSWLRFCGEERVRAEEFVNGSFKPNNSDTYLLNRLRLLMKISPTSWLQFTVQMQDSRAEWKTLRPYAPPYQDTFDLRQAYVEIGSHDQSPVSLRVGRQEINLGDERLVGSSDWTNTARTFDAIRLGLQEGKYSLDAFAATPVVLHDGAIGYDVKGSYLNGLYGGLANVLPDSKIEPYLLWHLNTGLAIETGGVGNLSSTTAGLRWVGKLPEGFDYGFEGAKQQGAVGTDRIDAWAGHWVVGYTVAAKWKPRLAAEFNYASGDHNPKDGVRGTFDQLFPSGHDKLDFADQVGWKNIMEGRTTLELHPTKRWLTAAKYEEYWLADAHDALYNSSGTVVAIRPAGTAGRYVGSEIDLNSMYQFSKQFKLGGGFARMFTGEFLNKTTPGKDYSYPYVVFTAVL